MAVVLASRSFASLARCHTPAESAKRQLHVFCRCRIGSRVTALRFTQLPFSEVVSGLCSSPCVATAWFRCILAPSVFFRLSSRACFDAGACFFYRYAAPSCFEVMTFSRLCPFVYIHNQKSSVQNRARLSPTARFTRETQSESLARGTVTRFALEGRS